jgi:REP element-mobilizing transposase RayT
MEKARKKGLSVNHFSIEPNHIHLLGEADSNERLTRGILSLQGCIKWGLKRVFNFVGRVFQGRFHLHELKMPREVRNAILYVIFNHAKHCRMPRFADAFSSAFSFDELRRYVRSPGEPPRWQDELNRVLSPAKSWLQRIGWKRFLFQGLT